MAKLITLLFTCSLAYAQVSGLPMTESTYADSTIVGTGYVVAKGVGEGRECGPQNKKNCRYYVVTSAHHMQGDNVSVCGSDNSCHKIKERNGKKQIISDSSRDITIVEVENDGSFEPYAYDGALGIMSLDSNKRVRTGKKKTEVDGMEFVAVGGIHDSELGGEVPHVPVTDWVSGTPVPHETRYSPELLDSQDHGFRTLAVSGNTVATAQIRPGQSGAPLTRPHGSGIGHRIDGHTLTYHRFASESTFLNSQVIEDSIDKLHSGKTGEVGKILGHPVQWKYDPNLGITYRVVEALGISEISKIGAQEEIVTLKADVAGSKKQGDGGNKKQGDGGSKKQGDGGSKKQGDGGNKKQGDGGNKKQGDGGSKKQGDGGSKKQGDGGSKKQGDGGIASCNPGWPHYGEEVELADQIREIESKLSLGSGMLYKNQRVIAFNMKKKDESSSETGVPIFADWEAMLLMDKHHEEYEFEPMGVAQDNYDILARRLNLKKKTCRSDVKCSVYRGEQTCSALEMNGDHIVVKYGADKNNLEKIVLNRAGAQINSSWNEFDPIAVKSTGDQDYFVDLTGLFYVDLNNVYSKSGESAHESIQKHHAQGPRIRVARKGKEEERAAALNDIVFNSCK